MRTTQVGRQGLLVKLLPRVFDIASMVTFRISYSSASISPVRRPAMPGKSAGIHFRQTVRDIPGFLFANIAHRFLQK